MWGGEERNAMIAMGKLSEVLSGSSVAGKKRAGRLDETITNLKTPLYDFPAGPLSS